MAGETTLAHTGADTTGFAGLGLSLIIGGLIFVSAAPATGDSRRTKRALRL